MSGKLYIKTHGCQMNEYDSAKMADVLGAAHGLELTEDEAEADVILINTCSIREKAQEKVFSQLGRWKSLKKDGKPVLIGVGGCVASQEGAAIVKRAPYVDLVFGPQTLHRQVQVVDQLRHARVDIDQPLREFVGVAGGVADALDAGDLGDVLDQQREVGDLRRLAHHPAVGIDVLAEQRDFAHTGVNKSARLA